MHQHPAPTIAVYSFLYFGSNFGNISKIDYQKKIKRYLKEYLNPKEYQKNTKRIPKEY